MRENAYYDFVRAFFVRAFIIKSALLETGHVSRSQIVCLVSERYNVIIQEKNSKYSKCKHREYAFILR